MQASLPPMHQFAKPVRNKLQASHRDRSSTPTQSTQQQKIHHQREASVHNLNLFARLSSFSTHGNHSGGSRRIDASSLGASGHTRRPSRDGLDWYCRGSKHSPLDDMPESPVEHARTPSLTHSRASSSDSGSGSSISSSYKPLPALPEPNFSNYSPFDGSAKLRPVSVAVLEQIDELSVGTFARKNSIETPAHIFLPHLDLAAREDISPAHSPSSSSNPTPRAGSLTVRQLSRSPSPTPGWTPRGSAFSMNSDTGDDSFSGPFALEASLAKLDVLSEDEEEDNDPRTHMLVPLQLEIPSPTSQSTPKPNGAFFRDKPDFSAYKWDAPTVIHSTSLEISSDAHLKTDRAPSPKPSPSMSHYIVPEVPEAEAASASTSTSPTSSTFAGRLSVKMPSFSRNGWRGWRSASQAATPTTRTSGDYPSIFVADHADDLAQALQSEINTAVQKKMLEASSPNESPKPKLSPQFTFGRGTPSPRLDDSWPANTSFLPSLATKAQEEHSRGQESHASTPRRGHNTSRAASEDHIAVQESRQWSWQGSASTTQTSSQTRLSHRTRLHLRKATTNQGPRNFAQSFDANELQRLRESAGGKPKYEWI